MKQFIHVFCFLILISNAASSQVTTPIIKAGFGVDADLRANYFNGFVQSGNDDWFNNGTAGTGSFVIDTTGAAATVAGYLSDVSPWPRRMATMYKSMRVAPFTIVNNRLWLDAIWVRDYHGFDTTVFSAGSNKNGMSPVDWSSPPSQAIPDKNDILDMFMHVRRAGPANTDSLWMFGGLSLDNVTGNRYFDFEMYQTDIYFDRGTGSWYGYGPDMGHTSWEFDSTGKVTKAGDVIFSSKFQSSTLSEVEARIWINKSALSLTPTQFSWSGQFDGDGNGATYGYASILPNTAGVFYTGLGSGTNTWAGPFRIVLQDNSIATNYIRDQFLEFSVNLSKLGLDPATLFGSNICGSPFNRIVVKTRASESFTSELKDFVAPLDLFLAPRANVAAEVPIFCSDTATSLIQVINPHPTSVYSWSTPDGNIVTPTNATWIQVNQAGTYIVDQLLMIGCDTYATDAAIVIRDTTCKVLPAIFKSFFGSYNYSDEKADLQWQILNNSSVSSFVLERSSDGRNFENAGIIFPNSNTGEASYKYSDDLSDVFTLFAEYRVRLNNKNGSTLYSKVLRINRSLTTKNVLTIAPNPVRDKFILSVTASMTQEAELIFMDMYGRPVMRTNQQVQKGANQFAMTVNEKWQPGVYYALIKLNQQTHTARFVVLK